MHARWCGRTKAFPFHRQRSTECVHQWRPEMRQMLTSWNAHGENFCSRHPTQPALQAPLSLTISLAANGFSSVRTQFPHAPRPRASCGASCSCTRGLWPGQLATHSTAFGSLYCIRALRPCARHGPPLTPSNMCGHVGGGAGAARASRVETTSTQPPLTSHERGAADGRAACA